VAAAARDLLKRANLAWISTIAQKRALSVQIRAILASGFRFARFDRSGDLPRRANQTRHLSSRGVDSRDDLGSPLAWLSRAA